MSISRCLPRGCLSYWGFWCQFPDRIEQDSQFFGNTTWLDQGLFFFKKKIIRPWQIVFQCPFSFAFHKRFLCWDGYEQMNLPPWFCINSNLAFFCPIIIITDWQNIYFFLGSIFFMSLSFCFFSCDCKRNQMVVFVMIRWFFYLLLSFSGFVKFLPVRRLTLSTKVYDSCRTRSQVKLALFLLQLESCFFRV